MSKYSKDGPFSDPVLRCDSCGAVVRTAAVKTLGSCPGDGVKGCGNLRFRNVRSMTEAEIGDLTAWGIDPEFIGLFEGVPNV